MTSARAPAFPALSQAPAGQGPSQPPSGSAVRFNLDAARIRPARLALAEARSPIGSAGNAPDPLILQRGDLVELLFIHTDAGPARRARDKERLQACVAQRLADGSWVGVLISQPLKDVGPGPGEAFLFASVHVLDVQPLQGLIMLEKMGGEVLPAVTPVEVHEGALIGQHTGQGGCATLNHRAGEVSSPAAEEGAQALDYLALCEALLRGEPFPGDQKT